MNQRQNRLWTVPYKHPQAVFIMEGQDPISYPLANTLSHWATATHWLPLMTNSHTPVQPGKTPPLDPKVSAYADLQYPLKAFNQVLYLDTHI